VCKPTDSNARLAPRKTTFRRIGIGVTLVAALIIVVWLRGLELAGRARWERHGRVSDRMEMAILRLAFHRPSDLTDEQWAYCIGWTVNLHHNFGVIPDWFPTDELERVAEQLEAEIDAGPSLATIDRIWDEYCREVTITLGGHERYRPTSPDNRAAFDRSRRSLSWYQAEYQRRLAEK
jgi:hypothetical protein